MGKKIVVITGSPRKNGNSLAMTNAFIEAAEAKGHSVTRFDAVSLNVGGCHACETCFRGGKACSFDDDFNSIAPAILEADTIVYTMPVYWYSKICFKNKNSTFFRISSFISVNSLLKIKEKTRRLLAGFFRIFMI